MKKGTPFISHIKMSNSDSLPKLTQCYIDSATTYEVLPLLSAGQAKDAYPWAWQNSVVATSRLINTPHLLMAPAPVLRSGAGGLYGQLTLGLADFMSHYRPTPADASDALQNTKRWARKNVAKVQSAYSKLMADTTNYQRWLDWSIANAWVEHAQRLGGLFNADFIPELSKIMSVPEADLIRVRTLSSDVREVSALVSRCAPHDDFRLLTDAYVISALLRGRFHDFIARKSGLQIMHHPLREGILSKPKQTVPKNFSVSNTERYLCNIVLASAFTEKNHADRISAWTGNVRKVKNAASAGWIDTGMKDSEEVALDLAVDAAKRLDIRVHAKRIDEVLDVALAVGCGALTSFILTDWPGFSAGLVEHAISKKVDLSKKVTGSLLDTKLRLRQLAVSEAGRIEPRWS